MRQLCHRCLPPPQWEPLQADRQRQLQRSCLQPPAGCVHSVRLPQLPPPPDTVSSAAARPQPLTQTHPPPDGAAAYSPCAVLAAAVPGLRYRLHCHAPVVWTAALPVLLYQPLCALVAAATAAAAAAAVAAAVVAAAAAATAATVAPAPAGVMVMIHYLHHRHQRQCTLPCAMWR